MILMLTVSSWTVLSLAAEEEETEPEYATGVYEVGGGYQYFEDGIFSPKTGVAERISDGKWVYVEQGVFKEATGLARRVSDGKLCYVKNGVFNKATGIAKSFADGKWYYVKNGVFKKATGLGRRISDGKWFYVKKGVYSKTSGHTTKIGNYKKIVYFKNGKRIYSSKLFTGMYRGRRYSQNNLVKKFKKTDWLTFLNSAGGSAKLEIRNGSITDKKLNQLKTAMENYRKKTTSFGFIAVNTKNGLVISYNPDQVYSTASTIKAPYVAALCKYHANGIASRKNDIYQTLMFSNNGTYASLYKTYGSAPVINFGKEVGVSLSFTDIPYTSVTTRELARLWCGMKAYIGSKDENVNLFKNSLLKHKTDSNTFRDYYKKGWWNHSSTLTGVYNCGGAGKDWVYAVMSNHPDTKGLPEETQEALITALSRAIH